MRIWAFAVRRWQFTLLLFGLLIAMGISTLQNIPRSEDPEFHAPIPIIVVVYPGADGTSRLYEDDGRTFAHRRGERMSIVMAWQDRTRRLSLSLAAGSKMLPPSPRQFAVRIAGQQNARTVTFSGKLVQITL